MPITFLVLGLEGCKTVASGRHTAVTLRCEEQFVTAWLCSEAVCRKKALCTRSLRLSGGKGYILFKMCFCDFEHAACDSKYEEGSGG